MVGTESRPQVLSHGGNSQSSAGISMQHEREIPPKEMRCFHKLWGHWIPVAPTMRVDVWGVCSSHHPWLLRALLETMEQQGKLCSAQAPKPTGGGDEGSEISLNCGTQPVWETHLSWVSLHHSSSLSSQDLQPRRCSNSSFPEMRNQSLQIMAQSSSSSFYFRSHLHPNQQALPGHPAWGFLLVFWGCFKFRAWNTGGFYVYIIYIF